MGSPRDVGNTRVPSVAEANAMAGAAPQNSLSRGAAASYARIILAQRNEKEPAVRALVCRCKVSKPSRACWMSAGALSDGAVAFLRKSARISVMMAARRIDGQTAAVRRIRR